MKVKKAYLRIVDANANRLKEALRVCEDLGRFVLNDKKLSASFKQRRHRVGRLLEGLSDSYRALVESRDSVSDVGRDRWIRDKSRDSRWQDILAANLKRAQEALRVLEEMAKVMAPRRVRGFERLRFDLYELEKKSFRKF